MGYGLYGLKEIFVLGRATDSSVTSIDVLYDDAGDLFYYEPVDPANDLYCILSSSGTTGPHKGVMISHLNYLHTLITLRYLYFGYIFIHCTYHILHYLMFKLKQLQCANSQDFLRNFLRFSFNSFLTFDILLKYYI